MRGPTAGVVRGATLVGILFVVGCGTATHTSGTQLGPTERLDRQVAAEERPADARRIIVSHDSGRLPVGCGPGAVANMIDGFLKAFNRGDSVGLDGYLQSSLEWFAFIEFGQDGEIIEQFLASTPQSGFGVFAPDRLPQGLRVGGPESVVPYLVERHERGERFSLRRIEVVPSWHGGTDVLFMATQSSTGPEVGRPPVGVTGGRGAINCGTESIRGLTLSMNLDGELLADLCSNHQADVPRSAILACARG
jgi:hypothetical protein